MTPTDKTAREAAEKYAESYQITGVVNEDIASAFLAGWKARDPEVNAESDKVIGAQSRMRACEDFDLPLEKRKVERRDAEIEALRAERDHRHGIRHGEGRLPMRVMIFGFVVMCAVFKMLGVTL